MKKVSKQLSNCSRCGQLFVRMQHPICPSCVKKREEDFARCRQYLRDNPETKMRELSEATGVKVQDIIQFIVEGRLILTPENTNLFYECERCGSPIRAGRLCASCSQQFESEVQDIVQKNQKDASVWSDSRHNYRIDRRKK